MFNLPSKLIPAWNLPKNYTTRLVRQQQNGGVIERGNPNEINLTSQRYQIKAFITSQSDYAEIDTFFNDRNGAAFLYNGTMYKCPSHRWTFDYNLWIFEAEFIQVFK